MKSADDDSETIIISSTPGCTSGDERLEKPTGDTA